VVILALQRAGFLPPGYQATAQFDEGWGPSRVDGASKQVMTEPGFSRRYVDRPILSRALSTFTFFAVAEFVWPESWAMRLPVSTV